MTDNSDTCKTASEEPTGQTHVCRATGREQGLVGKYDIWLCRQAFREMAPAMGFEKHE